MGNIIAALIVIVLSIFMVSSSAEYAAEQQNNNNLTANIVLEANELKQFADAVYNYSESLGTSLPSGTFTVAILKDSGLLPGSFPQTTPFGQSLQGSFLTDACNSNVMDLYVAAIGSYNDNLLAKNGLSGTLGANYIGNAVDGVLAGLNISYPNAQNPCVTGGPGDYIGYASGSEFNIYGGGAFPINTGAQGNGPAIFIYAPNQWGYEVIDSNIGGWNGGIWGAAILNSSQGIFMDQFGYWAISSPGWSEVCPAGSNMLGPGGNFNNFLYQNLYQAGYSYTETELFCVPLYKSQSVNLFYNLQYNNIQIINGGGIYANYFVSEDDGGSYYIASPPPGGYLLSNAMFIDGSEVSGLNGQLYAVSGYYSYPPWALPNPDTFIPPEAMPDNVAAVGFDINANGNIYQFSFWNYELFTGQGCPPSSVGMISPNPIGESFPAGAQIWATGYGNGAGACGQNSENLNTSSENYGVGYSAETNPANSGSFQGTVEYRANNLSNPQNIYFAIPTPQIN